MRFSLGCELTGSVRTAALKVAGHWNSSAALGLANLSD